MRELEKMLRLDKYKIIKIEERRPLNILLHSKIFRSLFLYVCKPTENLQKGSVKNEDK